MILAGLLKITSWTGKNKHYENCLCQEMKQRLFANRLTDIHSLSHGRCGQSPVRSPWQKCGSRRKKRRRRPGRHLRPLIAGFDEALEVVEASTRTDRQGGHVPGHFRSSWKSTAACGLAATDTRGRSATNASDTDVVRFQTLSPNPARSRFAAIREPMIPSPRNATRMRGTLLAGVTIDAGRSRAGAGIAPVPAAARRLDPQPLSGLQRPGRLRGQLDPVEQVAPARPRRAPRSTRRRVPAPLGDQRERQRRERLEFPDDPVPAPEAPRRRPSRGAPSTPSSAAGTRARAPRSACSACCSSRRERRSARRRPRRRPGPRRSSRSRRCRRRRASCCSSSPARARARTPPAPRPRPATRSRRCRPRPPPGSGR